jgi:uncharacterized membrane protein
MKIHRLIKKSSRLFLLFSSQWLLNLRSLWYEHWVSFSSFECIYPYIARLSVRFEYHFIYIFVFFFRLSMIVVKRKQDQEKRTESIFCFVDHYHSPFSFILLICSCVWLIVNKSRLLSWCVTSWVFDDYALFFPFFFLVFCNKINMNIC